MNSGASELNRRRRQPMLVEEIPVSYISNGKTQISTAARLPGSDSTKLVQNHYNFTDFGPVFGLQSGLGSAEMSGSGIWRTPGLRPLFLSAVDEQVAHRNLQKANP